MCLDDQFGIRGLKLRDVRPTVQTELNQNKCPTAHPLFYSCPWPEQVLWYFMKDTSFIWFCLSCRSFSGSFFFLLWLQTLVSLWSIWFLQSSALNRLRCCSGPRTSLSSVIFTLFCLWAWSRKIVMSYRLWYFPIGALWVYLDALYKGLSYLRCEQPHRVISIIPYREPQGSLSKAFSKET